MNPNESGIGDWIKNHPSLAREWWMNLYPDGQCTGALCRTKEEALNHCTYTGERPNAVQVRVRLVLAEPR